MPLSPVVKLTVRQCLTYIISCASALKEHLTVVKIYCQAVPDLHYQLRVNANEICESNQLLIILILLYYILRTFFVFLQHSGECFYYFENLLYSFCKGEFDELDIFDTCYNF